MKYILAMFFLTNCDISNTKTSTGDRKTPLSNQTIPVTSCCEVEAYDIAQANESHNLNTAHAICLYVLEKLKRNSTKELSGDSSSTLHVNDHSKNILQLMQRMSFCNGLIWLLQT